jgi:hypothetical protein
VKKALLALVIALVLAEASLRFLYRSPFAGRQPGINVIVPDPALGWANNPGTFEIALTPSLTMQLTHWPDGTRATSKTPADQRPKLLIAGCSYTWGGHLSDPDTYPWKLQSQVPAFHVANAASRAYSTYQGLLSIERYLDRNAGVKIVLFAFTSKQLLRNVADFEWTSTLAMGADVTYPSLPYVELPEEGKLLRRAPVPVEVSFLSRHSTLFSLLEVGWKRLLGHRYSHSELSAIAARLILEMKNRAEASGARFAMVDLLDPDDQVLALLRSSHVDVFECSRRLTSQDSIPEVGHPNAQVNQGWAECIQRELSTRHWVGPT